jgi:hypothetical protein
MRTLDNKGMALVTALMLTLITLVMIMGLMFVITNNLKSGGATKTYRNVTEAAYGGSDLIMQDIIPRLMTPTLSDMTNISGEYSGIGLNFGNSACVTTKLNKSRSDWGACSNTLNSKVQPDVTFNLSASTGQSFTVYSKIVDTSPGIPYIPTPPGGLLIGGGVAESSAGTTTNLAHYIYRIEITGERTSNPLERSHLSILYEY